MVSSGLVIAIALGLVVLVSGLSIFGTAGDFLKRKLTPEQIALEQKMAASRAEKGAFGNTVDFFLGEGTVQKNREIQLTINKEAKVEEIAKAARQQGFSSVEEFERATDSCSLVVGSSRTMCDIGLIGSQESIAPKGGQTKVGTGVVKVGGKQMQAPSTTVRRTVGSDDRSFNPFASITNLFFPTAAPQPIKTTTTTSGRRF